MSQTRDTIGDLQSFLDMLGLQRMIDPTHGDAGFRPPASGDPLRPIASPMLGGSFAGLTPDMGVAEEYLAPDAAGTEADIWAQLGVQRPKPTLREVPGKPAWWKYIMPALGDLAGIYATAKGVSVPGAGGFTARALLGRDARKREIEEANLKASQEIEQQGRTAALARGLQTDAERRREEAQIRLEGRQTEAKRRERQELIGEDPFSVARGMGAGPAEAATLHRLNYMLDKGLISQERYEAIKKELDAGATPTRQPQLNVWGQGREYVKNALGLDPDSPEGSKEVRQFVIDVQRAGAEARAAGTTAGRGPEPVPTANIKAVLLREAAVMERELKGLERDLLTRKTAPEENLAYFGPEGSEARKTRMAAWNADTEKLEARIAPLRAEYAEKLAELRALPTEVSAEEYERLIGRSEAPKGTEPQVGVTMTRRQELAPKGTEPATEFNPTTVPDVGKRRRLLEVMRERAPEAYRAYRNRFPDDPALAGR